MISASQLEDIGQFVIANEVDDGVLPELRKRFSDLHFTYCMDDDVISAQPVMQHPGFNLYLVDTRNHCFAFTQDADIATGVVVAALEDE